MKIYVAGKYQDRDRVRVVYQILREHGHEITLDWTNHNIYPNDAVAEKLSGFAQDDVSGVLSADLFIGLMTIPYEYKGLWVEMGIALGKGIPVYIIGNAGDSCIFTNHPLVKKFTEIFEVPAGSYKIPPWCPTSISKTEK